MTMALKAACAFMIVIFFISCAVQYNDPDPWMWIALYAASGAVSVLPMIGRHTVLVIPMGLAYFGYAMYNMPHIAPGEWLTTETSRESGGLMVCAVWMAILSAMWYRHKLSAAPAQN